MYASKIKPILTRAAEQNRRGLLRRGFSFGLRVTRRSRKLRVAVLYGRTDKLQELSDDGSGKRVMREAFAQGD